MTDAIKRSERLGKLSKVDSNLEKIESLNDINKLYRKTIKAYLNEITTDNTLQKQIKHEMGII
jgi:hypothetical protein